MSEQEKNIEVQFEQDTRKHVQAVQKYLNMVIKDLLDRGNRHDESKFSADERKYFIEHTQNLAGITYNSPEYIASLEKIKPALTSHYAKNDHHPAHFVNGIDDMNLVQIIELFCDWLASSQRHRDGNIRKSISENKIRYNLSDQMTNVFENTATWFENNI